MEEIKSWLSGNPEPWQIVVGCIVLLALVAQRLATIRDAWFNYRKGLSDLIYEKHRLEVLKLQYEIQALKKTHQLESLEPASTPSIPPPPPLTTTREAGLRSPFWRWMLRHTLIAQALFSAAHILLGFNLFVFVIGLATMPFMAGTDPTFRDQPWMTVLVWVIYALLTYACYRGFRRVSAWRHEFLAEASG